ncbi:purine and uridine phosphorylase [Viridothelium virens]|uniref:Purine and uridine phosphorylase n=1 Tax=Viridothelium virens TaxID=1048519 RepID=A0A6A6HEU9_VIRVR|nr:purine and uridine phosphorylase [Viridothelium virens]
MSNSKEYTVAWICAIHTEYVAAQALLDERHKAPEYVSPNDNNHYTLGKFGKHNVVIAVLPDGEYGIIAASSVAKDIVHTFSNIRIGLVVGIAGGAPSLTHDIRLGDIVVSAPRDGKGGVFQYDFGKTIQNQSFHSTGFLNQPPKVLRAAVAGLRAQYEVEGHQLRDTINGGLKRKPRLWKKYQRPDPATDHLYKSDVIHVQQGTSCAVACGDSPSTLVSRDERTEDEDDPTIHYGLIASANQLMKDAEIRDKLAEEMDVLCFEMEAAGLMNDFPCLVIRGVCDYSDTHKNNHWQGYAAMAAAAYAKDLLSQIAPTQLEMERKVVDVLDSFQRTILGTQDAMQRLEFIHQNQQIDRWLHPPDPSTNFNKALQLRQKGTGSWLLKHPAFNKWTTKPGSFLWLHGIPGCGKTVLSTTVLEELRQRLACRPLLYFFCDFNDAMKRTLEQIVRSLISQLYYQQKTSQASLERCFSSRNEGRSQPSCEALCNTFVDMIKGASEVWILIDALDECTTRSGHWTEGILPWMAYIFQLEGTNIHLLITSRLEQDIQASISDWNFNKDIISLQSEIVADDIRAYVRARIREDTELKRWQFRPDVQREIEINLVDRAHGMFRWVACQLDALANYLDYRSLRNTLATLPKTLDETYDRILQKIPDEYIESSIRALQFVTFSKRPLSVKEVRDAIAVDPEYEPHFDRKNRMPDPREILRHCSGLVVFVSIDKNDDDSDDDSDDDYDDDNDNVLDQVLQLAHFSVKEYFTSMRILAKFGGNFEEATMIQKTMLYMNFHLHTMLPHTGWTIRSSAENETNIYTN